MLARATAMPSQLDLLGLTSNEAIEAARRLLPSGAGVAGKLYARAFATGALEPEAVGLSAASCRAWRAAFTVGLLEVRRTVEEPGEHGATVKAVLATRDGHEIECVRIPVPVPAGSTPRATLCISSQVGCRMGCAFCETGRMGLVRNLSAAEIVSQVVTAHARLGWDCRNLVFMGMGEPLDNLAELAHALRVLTDMRGLRYPAERVTVCTAGDAEGIRGLRALGMRADEPVHQPERGRRRAAQPADAREPADEPRVAGRRARRVPAAPLLRARRQLVPAAGHQRRAAGRTPGGRLVPRGSAGPTSTSSPTIPGRIPCAGRRPRGDGTVPWVAAGGRPRGPACAVHGAARSWPVAASSGDAGADRAGSAPNHRCAGSAQACGSAGRAPLTTQATSCTDNCLRRHSSMFKLPKETLMKYPPDSRRTSLVVAFVASLLLFAGLTPLTAENAEPFLQVIPRAGTRLRVRAQPCVPVGNGRKMGAIS